MNIESNGNTPGKYSLIIDLLFESDNEPVNTSILYVDGTQANGADGRFTFEDTSYSVSKNLLLTYSGPGIGTVNVSGVVSLFGNTGVYFFSFFSVFVISYNTYLGRKEKSLAVSLKKQLPDTTINVSSIASNFRNNEKRTLRYLRKYIEKQTLDAVISYDEKTLIGFKFLEPNFDVKTIDELTEKSLITNPKTHPLQYKVEGSIRLRKRRFIIKHISSELFNVRIRIQKPNLNYSITLQELEA